MDHVFVHLHLHTEYSLVDGIVRIPQLCAQAAQHAVPALAITDHNNLFAAVKFYCAAIRHGIKPIIGVDLSVQHALDNKPPQQIVLLCQNEMGYRHLTCLLSRAYLAGQQHGMPMIQRAWLQQDNAGLLVLSGGVRGDVGQALLAGETAQAQQLLQAWQADFPDRFYLELQRTGRPGEEAYIDAVLALASSQGVPVVATNDVCFLQPEDFDAHDARVCINQGHVLDDNSRPKAYSEQQYLRTPHEMQMLFADIPSAVQNSVEIAKRCNLQLSLGKVHLPIFPLPGTESVEAYLAKQAQAGLHQRLQLFPTEHALSVYQERLAHELSVINTMGFASYFLIVADFIQWAKAQQIPVGPGRGSGAGSLVAYALNITDLDPLVHDLLFERFLNPERVSLPDFDIDFCMDRRDEVIDYVADKYGRSNVSQIITYGTMAARAVLRDVGRVLGYPYGFVDKLVKLLPFALGMTLEKALQQEERLQQRYDEEEEVRNLFVLAKKLEGLTRNVGKHAGGIVIAPTQLTDFTPLYCEAGGGNLVTQFDKDDIESVGLIKFDFLGLRTLTIIDWAVRAINQRRRALGESDIVISALPMDDPSTFALLCACATTAVFQLESRGMKDLIKRLQPDCFEEITALVALFRPGPLQSGMVDDFIDRKHGRAKVEYFHPDLQGILRPTYGVILYQEQVMQIAQVLAGYSLGEADILRRAMGKKKAEEMAKQRVGFVARAMQRGVEEKLATYIFDLMEKFSGYGFNKSHSAAYALLAYQTAWLKAHYPAEFMAAVLSSDLDNTDKVVALIDECQRLGLTVVPPHINTSDYHFTVDAQRRIVYGLGAIKGVGDAAVGLLTAARQQGGDFTHLFAVCQRVDLRKINRRTLDALIRAGALDGLGPHRAALLASVDKAIQLAERVAQDKETGMLDLFANVTGVSDDVQSLFHVVAPWSEAERLDAEKDSLGLYLSGHPFTRYQAELRSMISATIAVLPTLTAASATVAGLVVAIRTMQTKRGERMAFVTLDDTTGRVEIAVFPEAWQTYRECIEQGKLLIVEGEISFDEYSGNYRVSSKRVLTLNQARQQYARGLLIHLAADQVSDKLSDALRCALQPFCAGTVPVYLVYQHALARVHVLLGERWQINPDDLLCDALRQIPGCTHVEFTYR